MWGGQYRARFHAEQNFRGLGLTGLDDRFLLHRTRLFGHLRGELVHVYAEMIVAESNYQDLPPRAIEVHRADLLNLFGDVVLGDADRGRASLRVGRQELLYGAQRLISPLDWGHTRRTFEGAHFFWTGENWNLDAFLTQAVLTRPTPFDRPADQPVFFGSYATYKGWQNQTIDLYALQFNDNRAPADFRFTTLGGRWLGKRGN